MKTDTPSPAEKPVRFTWKRTYTLLLVLNAIYILLFYYLMQIYT